MTDLGLFEPRSGDDTGNVGVEEIRAALAKGAVDKAPSAPPSQAAPRQLARARREAQAKRRRRRRRHTVVALVVLIVLAAVIAGGLLLWRKKQTTVPEFTGTVGPQVIVHIQDSDTRTDVANRLFAAGVVASVQGFLDATVTDGDVAKIPPGYYRLSSHLGVVIAANALVDKANRVGQLQIVPGLQLADAPSRTIGAAAVPGYISQITTRACVPMDGVSRCFTADDLWRVAQTADLDALNLPEWAVEDVAKAPDARRRLEGMIRPGDYNVPPTADPQVALAAVLSESTALWSTSDVVAGAKEQGITPYQAVVVASLVEKEAIAVDMPKAAEVIFNRYETRMKLQLDSTINYAFARTTLATTATDRARDSPYNTYLHDGLPPTPIDSPGKAALAGALTPLDGPWLFFVIIDKQGNSCFSVTFQEHQKCVAQSHANGVF